MLQETLLTHSKLKWGEVNLERVPEQEARRYWETMVSVAADSYKKLNA